MPTKLIELDGVLIEVEVPQNQARPILGGQALKVSGSFEKIQPLLSKTCRPIIAAWQEIHQELNVEQADIEIGLGFESEGNVYITKTRTDANLTIRMTIKPKRQFS